MMVTAVLIAGLAPGAAAAPPPWSADHQRYRIEARLDAQRHVIEGRARIHFPNPSSAPLQTLEFHLYANAFAHDATVFMHEEGFALRDSRLVHWGGTDVQVLAIDGEADLLVGAEYELRRGDRTQLRVFLPTPLQPGQSLELVIAFRTRLPNMVARMGFAGSFHMIAQWFPKLAKLRPDGSWANFPYHGMGEFHADFADYRVTLDVPAGMLVAGTGKLREDRARGDRRVMTFEALRVHDVAFVAAPDLQRRRRRIEGVDVELLFPAGYEMAARRQFGVVADGLRHFGQVFGRYPWDTLSVLIPPRRAQPISAMEYPGFIVTGGPWWALPEYLPDPAHDLVTSHELAHQWFYAAVATHEVEEPFLDEGLAEWAALDLMRIRHRRQWPFRTAVGPGVDVFDALALVGRTLPTALTKKKPSRGRAGPMSSLKPAYAYDRFQLAGAIYVRPPLVLETVGRTWGIARLRRALGSYARRHRFGHPTATDLFRAFDDVYWPGFSSHVLRPALAGQRTGVIIQGAPGQVAPGAGLSAKRTGALPLPLQVQLTTPAGRRLQAWPAHEASFVLAGHGGRIDRIVVDPDRHNLLARRRDLRAGIDDGSPARRWWSHAVFWFQQLLLAVGT